MTPYQHAWLELIQARDQLYLTIFLAVLLGYGWYRFMFHRFFWLSAAGCVLAVYLGLAWGLWHLMKG